MNWNNYIASSEKLLGKESVEKIAAKVMDEAFRDIKLWYVEPVARHNPAHAVCVMARSEEEAIEKAKHSKLFYLIEPFGPEFKAENAGEYNKGDNT